MFQLKPIVPVPPMARDMDIMANRLPSTRALDGATVALRYDDGATMTMALADGRVRWEAQDGGRSLGGEGPYDAVEMRSGLFFLDFAATDGSVAFSHVLDREQGRSLTVWNEIVGEGEALDLKELLRPARVDGSGTAYLPIAQTRDLLGKRLYCEYGPEAALEHIYVNSCTIVWQWLLSPPALEQEVGIEAATMWKIRDQLYLLSTRGPDPIELTLLLDLEQGRNVGRLFGRGGFGTVDRRCGAKITFLGAFDYPQGYEPG